MPNYQLNKKWSKVDQATDCPNVFATMSGSEGSYVSSLSGAEIYALLQENPKQMILLKDVNGRDCMLTTPPTSGAATLKFSVLVGTIAYIYTIASGGSAVVVSTVDFSSSAGESDIFSFNITYSGGIYSMDTTWADIAAAKQAGKLIVANPGGDYVYYSCGDPTDDGITLSCVFYTSTGAKMRSFTIDTDGVITYNGVTNFTADNVVKYTPQSLSSAQQAQACSNIGAANKVVVRFAFLNNAYVCDKTFAAISEAVSNNAVIEAVFGNYSGFLSYISGTEAIFVTTGLPSIPQIFTFKVTSSDVVTAATYSLDNDGVWSAEAKEALIACFEQVSWKTTYGQTYLSALETALYPETHLVSITAAYDQDRPIYDTDSLDLVKLDLVVTANYSDGTSEVVNDYTLSGTLTPGTSTITVSYGGKTASISVEVYYISPAYQQCEWIGASGTQYINTGVIPTGYSKCILDFESSKTNADAYQSIFGTAGDTPQGGGGIQHRFDMFIGSANTSATFAASELAPNFGAGVYTAAVSLPSATYVNQRLTYTADENTWSASVGTYSANLSGTKTSMTRLYPVFIFARNGEGTAANLATGKLYGATFEDASGHAFNLVPCYNKTSGEIGVFDKVSKVFIGNSGTGTFTKGNDVS